jgi:hypothetical protein
MTWQQVACNHWQQVTTITRTARPSSFTAWFYTVALLLLAIMLVIYGGPVHR